MRQMPLLTELKNKSAPQTINILLLAELKHSASIKQPIFHACSKEKKRERLG